VGVEHYENFPVASVLCPAALRAPIRALYRYARTADDLADEGQASPAQRREALEAYRAALHAAAEGRVGARWPEVFAPLAEAIAAHRLPLPLLDDLLDAFVQDAVRPGYASRTELLDYCRRSANPIGRLLLHLHRVDDPAALRESDAICTALQLINFWQDPSVDLPRGRCCFALEDLQRHGLDARTLAGGADSPASQALIRELSAWAAGLLAEGAPLVWRLPGRVGWELRLVVQGGRRILEKIAALQYRTLSQRPTLGPRDWPLMLWRAARMRPRRAAAGLLAA
jgi:squalene synthase HpnC